MRQLLGVGACAPATCRLGTVYRPPLAKHTHRPKAICINSWWGVQGLAGIVQELVAAIWSLLACWLCVAHIQGTIWKEVDVSVPIIAPILHRHAICSVAFRAASHCSTMRAVLDWSIEHQCRPAQLQWDRVSCGGDPVRLGQQVGQAGLMGTAVDMLVKLNRLQAYSIAVAIRRGADVAGQQTLHTCTAASL